MYINRDLISRAQCYHPLSHCYCERPVICAIVDRPSYYGVCYLLEESYPGSSAMELDSRPHHRAIAIRSYASRRSLRFTPFWLKWAFHCLLYWNSAGSDARALCKSPTEAHTRIKYMTSSRSLILMSIYLSQQPVSNTYEEGGRSQDSCCQWEA